jgi:hypothetical protein
MSIVTTAPSHRGIRQLEIIRISDCEWRVSDPRRRDDDALCLIGFIQRVDDVFEVTLIGRPRDRHYFRSFGEATGFLGRPEGDTPPAEGRRAWRWPAAPQA